MILNIYADGDVAFERSLPEFDGVYMALDTVKSASRQINEQTYEAWAAANPYRDVQASFAQLMSYYTPARLESLPPAVRVRIAKLGKKLGLEGQTTHEVLVQFDEALADAALSRQARSNAIGRAATSSDHMPAAGVPSVRDGYATLSGDPTAFEDISNMMNDLYEIELQKLQDKAEDAAGRKASSPITWGRAKGYEVSSKGDARFSALTAKMPDGRTIEEHYQGDVKGYDVGGTDWKLGKGKPPKTDHPGDSLYEAYKALWRTWAARNPRLMEELRGLARDHGNALSDRFANTPVNQARALADLLNETGSSRSRGVVAGYAQAPTKELQASVEKLGREVPGHAGVRQLSAKEASRLMAGDTTKTGATAEQRALAKELSLLAPLTGSTFFFGSPEDLTALRTEMNQDPDTWGLDLRLPEEPIQLGQSYQASGVVFIANAAPETVLHELLHQHTGRVLGAHYQDPAASAPHVRHGWRRHVARDAGLCDGERDPPPLIRWSVQEIRRVATRLAQRQIQPAHVIAWSLWRRAHQAAAQHAHLRSKEQL